MNLKPTWFKLLAGSVLLGAVPAGHAQVIHLDGFENLPSFQVNTPPIQIAAGEESLLCYFFRSPNSVNHAIHKWQLSKGAGIAKVSLYATYDANWQPVEVAAPGTVNSNCNLGSASARPAWLFDTRQASDELVFPNDDGTGVPLAFELLPNQPLVLVVNALNETALPVTTSASMGAESRTPGNPFTRSASHTAENFSFNIAPLQTVTISQSCSSTGGSYWWMSMQTRRNGSLAEALNGASPLLASNDWESPSELLINAPPFVSFPPNNITYRCTYSNPNNNSIQSGDSEVSNEQCRFVSYFFPATHPAICIDNILLP